MYCLRPHLSDLQYTRPVESMPVFYMPTFFPLSVELATRLPLLFPRQVLLFLSIVSLLVSSSSAYAAQYEQQTVYQSSHDFNGHYPVNYCCLHGRSRHSRVASLSIKLVRAFDTDLPVSMFISGFNYCRYPCRQVAGSCPPVGFLGTPVLIPRRRSVGVAEQTNVLQHLKRQLISYVLTRSAKRALATIPEFVVGDNAKDASMFIAHHSTASDNSRGSFDDAMRRLLQCARLGRSPK